MILTLLTRRASPPSKQPRGPLVFGAALLVIMCMGCCGTWLALPAGSTSGRLAGGYVVQVCVGINTAPRLQVGLTWIAPFLSSLPPVLLQHALCALVPWLPILPRRGGFAFP